MEIRRDPLEFEVSRKKFLRAAFLATGSMFLGTTSPITSAKSLDSIPATMPAATTRALLSATAKPDDPKDILSKFTEQAGRFSSPEEPLRNLGFRISDAFNTALGWEVAYQATILRLNPETNEISPINLLDDFHISNLDDQLNRGQLGVTVPEQIDLPDLGNPSKGSFDDLFKARLEVFGIEEKFQTYLKTLKERLNFGFPTSRVRDYDDTYEVLRLQRGAVQFWKTGDLRGQFTHILVGQAAAVVPGYIPAQAKLSIPILDYRPIILPPVAADNSSPSCRPTNQTLRGVASYYSRAGCLGCNSDFRMANGETLDDNKLTIALLDPSKLNSWVLITNQANGRKVIAKVTDTGGFGKYGRVADLSLATKNSLGAETDKSPLEIAVCG